MSLTDGHADLAHPARGRGWRLAVALAMAACCAAAGWGAYAIALQRYQAGLGNYLQVLSAETAVLAQRRQGVDLAARAIDTQVQLIRALGGGYTEEPATAAVAAAPATAQR